MKPLRYALAVAVALSSSALVVKAEAQPQPPQACGEQEAELAQLHHETYGNYQQYGADVAAYMQKCAKGETITVPQPFAGSYCDLNKSLMQTYGRVTCIKR